MSVGEGRACRVCGGPATRGLPDGWYCGAQDCLNRRTWGRELTILEGDRASSSCTPTRCYCGWHDWYEPLPPVGPPRGPQTPEAYALEARAHAAAVRASMDAVDDPGVIPGVQPTSKAAALGVLPVSGTQRRAVFDAIVDAWRRGYGGATDPEVQRHLGLAPNSERPRRNELCDAGLVVNSGRVRKHEGRDHVVWRPTEDALGAIPSASPNE